MSYRTVIMSSYYVITDTIYTTEISASDSLATYGAIMCFV